MKNYDQLIDLALVELESCETLNSLEKATILEFISEIHLSLSNIVNPH